MKKGALSRTQLAVLVWAGVLAPAAELLPGAVLSAGRGACSLVQFYQLFYGC